MPLPPSDVGPGSGSPWRHGPASSNSEWRVRRGSPLTRGRWALEGVLSWPRDGGLWLLGEHHAVAVADGTSRAVGPCRDPDGSSTVLGLCAEFNQHPVVEAVAHGPRWLVTVPVVVVPVGAVYDGGVVASVAE